MAKKDLTLVKIGANLRRAREAKGWSQEELAYECGVHRTYVGGVERAWAVATVTMKLIGRCHVGDEVVEHGFEWFPDGGNARDR